MPSPKTAKIRIAILLGDRSAPGLALLARDVFRRANRLLADERYQIEFVSANASRTTYFDGLSIETKPLRGRYDYLIVPPFDGFTEDQYPDERDVRCVQAQSDKGTVIASACLGALVLASAGMLDGKDATTHWAWASVARTRHPAVNWSPSRMICDQHTVITAGGYLAAVDLALHIVGKTTRREIAHQLGQRLLADSVRQKQSVYAQTLIDPTVEHEELSAIGKWIDRHLDQALDAELLAKRCNMSLRTFHRRFADVFGTTPRKFVQVKRVERAQELLRKTSKSIEQIVSEVGVSDPVSFRRVFQRELGFSPAEFRRKLRREQTYLSEQTHA
ncbi:MAG TPA: helix-turn-helix domain-containing protein [Steroidobacteraceae bacterium]|nr:helix-turn-helix domain-containing protein [Steroidobacteraceae bacterium]